MLIAAILIVLAYDLTLALCAKCCSLFSYRFGITSCSCSVIIFTSDLVGRSVQYFYVIEDATVLAESDIMPPLPAGLDAIVGKVGLSLILQVSKRSLKETHSIYLRSLEEY